MSLAPRLLSRIYLVGFMGAGKSTVGPLLAARLHWAFEDIDRTVEGTSGKPVAQIFADSGEIAFRSLESAAVQAASSRARCVVALGGGAIETEAVRNVIASDSSGMSVFLEAPLELLLERCRSEAAGRPLLADISTLSDRYKKRYAFYQSAHLTQATEKLSPEEVAAEIVQRMAAFARWKN